jgi:SAM-dependent methyltransferase
MTKYPENFRAYDGYEMLGSFTSESFTRYCHEKLESCRIDVELISRYCIHPRWTGAICEIGSGNSKLLYSLEREGLLERGLGIETSQSRHRFAEAFRRHVGSKKVTNLNANLFDVEPKGEFDLVCGLDIVLQMIAPVSDDAEERLFSWISRSLKTGGHLVAELRDFQRQISIIKLTDDGSYRFWEEFPAPDPWRYNLNRLAFVDQSESDLVWEKDFLRRDSLEKSSTRCIFRPYSEVAFRTLITQHGFESVATVQERPGLFTVVARKIDLYDEPPS